MSLCSGYFFPLHVQQTFRVNFLQTGNLTGAPAKLVLVSRIFILQLFKATFTVDRDSQCIACFIVFPAISIY